jgi:putative aminopeptidase FrvX
VLNVSSLPTEHAAATADHALADRNRELLQELLFAYGPCGQEEAVRDVVARELADSVDEMWVDAAGNLIGHRKGAGGSAQAPIIRVMAHLDELSMIVKRVTDDGDLHVHPLGEMYPANFGLGPVALLGDRETLTGVLTLGSEHTTAESTRIWETKPDQGDKALDWSHVYIFTGRSKAELEQAGISIGTRICIDRSKRTLVDVGDFVGSYFLDNRAAITITIDAARRLAAADRPPGDVYFVFSTSEEMGGVGASYASRVLPGDVTLALDVGPTEAEYQTTVSSSPIVAFADVAVVYDKSIADRLVDLGNQLGFPPQRAVFGAYMSDASNAKAKGQSAAAALLSLPTLSTHGYEVIHRGAIDNCARLLAAYLQRPVG